MFATMKEKEQSTMLLPLVPYATSLDAATMEQLKKIAEEHDWTLAQTGRNLIREAIAARKAKAARK